MKLVYIWLVVVLVNLQLNYSKYFLKCSIMDKIVSNSYNSPMSELEKSKLKNVKSGIFGRTSQTNMYHSTKMCKILSH